MSGSVVVIGGSSGLGKAVAAHYAAQGRQVVVTSRDEERAEEAAREIGGSTTGIAVDISRPAEVASALAGVGPVQYLVIAAIERDENTIRDYAVDRAIDLATLKLVGYPAVIHALHDRFTDDAAVVLFGGLAKDRPYPGSTMVSTVNGGISTLINTLALELAPLRFNAIHPAVVGDTPYWQAKPAEVLEGIRSRTPTGRLVTTADIVHAVAFLLENQGVNAINLVVDGGSLLK
ncbi:MAG TPA: SDR family oxidoreductase [Acidimicrobiia bacterium]|jgi:NAD(P)-dependent dehydrogenase (short-subunit alcohol dehydrogenase family)